MLKSFSITPQQSKFDNVEFTELINPNRIDELLTFQLNEDYENEVNKTNEYVILSKLKSRIVDNKLKVKYHHSKKTEVKLGRVFAEGGLSLQSLRKDIRHYLVYDTYDDIDISNCYYSILTQLCKMNGLKEKQYRKILDYTDNRSIYLDKIKSIYGKYLYLMLLHGGNVETWKKKYECSKIKVNISKIKSEINKIGTNIHQRNPALQTKWWGQTMSLVLQHYENMILEVIYDFLKTRGISVENCVLCFDGLMIPKSEKNNEELLRLIEEEVLIKTGFKISLIYKTMNKPTFPKKECSITKELNKRKVELYLDAFKRNESGCAELCYNHFKDVIRKVTQAGSKYYVYDEKTKLWLISTKSRVINLYSEFLNKCSNTLNEIITDKELITKDIQKICKNFNTLKFNSNLLELSNDFYYEEGFIFKLNSHPHLLPLKNCKVINLKTKEVRERTYDDYFTDEINIEYDPNIKDNVFEKFVKELLNDEHYSHFFQKYNGYTITGENKEQIIAIWWGKQGGNAKSLIVNLIQSVMGKLFTGTLNKKMILKNSNYNNQLDLFHSRYCRSLYLSESNEDDKLDFGELKKYSGEDEVVCRGHYEDPVKYKPYFKLINPLNFMYKFNVNDKAFFRRIMVFVFRYYFRNEDDIDYDETNELCKKRDINMKEKINEETHILKWLIDGAYNYYKEGLQDVPQIMKDAKEEYFNDNDPVAMFVKTHLEPYDKCVISDERMKDKFKEFMKENRSKFKFVSSLKFKKELKRFGLECKMRRNNIWGYYGFKFKGFFVEEDEEESDELEDI